MVDKKPILTEEEIRKRQEAAQEQFKAMRERDVKKSLEYVATLEPEAAIKQLTELTVNLRHDMMYLNAHINNLIGAVDFLLKEHHHNKEEKCPVSLTNIDNKDLILEKDDDKQSESE